MVYCCPKKILTPSEINLVEKRLAVLHLLKEGLAYCQISEITDVHRSTISFIKSGFVKIKKLKTRERGGGFPKTILRETQSPYLEDTDIC